MVLSNRLEDGWPAVLVGSAESVSGKHGFDIAMLTRRVPEHRFLARTHAELMVGTPILTPARSLKATEHRADYVLPADPDQPDRRMIFLDRMQRGSRVRIIQSQWSGVTGLALAAKVYQVAGRGCDVRVIYGTASAEVIAMLESHANIVVRSLPNTRSNIWVWGNPLHSSCGNLNGDQTATDGLTSVNGLMFYTDNVVLNRRYKRAFDFQWAAAQ